jgi:UDP-N-acetylmuramoyl-tripeptide--D-alanyl-D-alanine ligase
MKRFSWTGERVREALGLAAASGDVAEYAGISTDTRTLRAGELFVALRGAHYDGAAFICDAAEAGAAGAVAERRPEGLPDGFELFVVDDPLVALGKLAAARRQALNPTVVAITGTSGKTTTRELTLAVLDGRAYTTPRNYNNLVGTPLSMLSAPEEASVWILEVASNSPGEIATLGQIVRPDYAVITSVGEGHLEGLGDLQGVMTEKLSLLPRLRPGGRALVADEPDQLGRRAREQWPDTLTVGLSDLADERPERWFRTEAGVGWRWHGVDFELGGFGSHLICDALFACCIAHLLGVDPVDAARRLRNVELPPMRGEVRRVDGIDLLVDCYNANPASFRAALDALDSLAAGRKRAVLAGTMLELGERSQALHEEVACLMVSAGIEFIAGCGAFREAFNRCPRSDLILEERLEDAYQALAGRLAGDEAVLIKASRGMKFERAIPWFERDFGTVGRETSTADS